MSSENSTEEIVRQLKAFASQFTKGLAPENLITCEELWKLMNESDEYILLVDTRSDVEISVSKIKGAITYAEYMERMDNENFPFVKTVFYSTIGKRTKGVKAYSLEGGLIKWCNYEKGELVDTNGSPTHMIHVFNAEYRPLFNSSYICVY
ncbi:hypothetical protein JH06_4593 [Blastocystis sp. subtype 4]|uniref:hypothetical protein n=1 Tax=Blastocystis sp. subtype 4 TaxID=944170 RepID=UPI0007118029|nr:hypothetical protein JH06_4593 [Blastocystis sp. subtype 4]KNB41874.1 hypothetical protein JH06_4593 [Blastocystis sp. subtype 4]|eukprot:XP_014525317.1 hypothetical protein JH06_4593 [Blastocystis sp. subtype 4]